MLTGPSALTRTVTWPTRPPKRLSANRSRALDIGVNCPSEISRNGRCGLKLSRNSNGFAACFTFAGSLQFTAEQPCSGAGTGARHDCTGRGSPGQPGDYELTRASKTSTAVMCMPTRSYFRKVLIWTGTASLFWRRLAQPFWVMARAPRSNGKSHQECGVCGFLTLNISLRPPG